MCFLFLAKYWSSNLIKKLLAASLKRYYLSKYYFQNQIMASKHTPHCAAGFSVLAHLFVTCKRKKYRPFLKFEDPQLLSESIYSSMYFREQSTGRIYSPIETHAQYILQKRIIVWTHPTDLFTIGIILLGSTVMVI